MTLLFRFHLPALIALLCCAQFARAQETGKPDIYFDRTQLPLGAAVLVDRMEDYAKEMRGKAQAAIDARLASVIEALKKEQTIQEEKGNKAGAAAIAKQLRAWQVEAEARKASEAWWKKEKDRQKGANWKSMMKDPNSMEGWAEFPPSNAFDCADGVISVDAKLMALAIHSCGSESVVVRGKMRVDEDPKKKGIQQAGIGFQQDAERDGGFACLFQYPENHCVIYGGFEKGSQDAVALKRARVPGDKFTDIQVALVKGALIAFVDGKKVAEYKHPELGTPPGIYLFAGNIAAQFKNLEMLSPNKAQIESLLGGKPIR